MKAMLAAFAAAIILAVAADVVLDGMGYSSQQANTGSAVRLDGASE